MAEERKDGEAAATAKKPAAEGETRPAGRQPVAEKKAKAPRTEAAAARQPAAEKGAKPARDGGKGGGEKAKGGGEKAKGGGEKGEKGQKKAAEKAPKLPVKEPRLRVLYREKVAKALREEFAYSSVQQVPKLEKIVVSMGVGEALANKKLLDAAVKELAQITGLKPVKTKAKKSIANFKVRKGNEIGAMVTLRGYHMYEFLDRLTNVALPRVKDFRGTNPNAFDGRGNYALGLTEQIIFPEIDYDKIERVSGMNIAICTTARTDQEARHLLAALGMPFRK
jgi:large subunit ribosomal protein L5